MFLKLHFFCSLCGQLGPQERRKEAERMAREREELRRQQEQLRYEQEKRNSLKRGREMDHGYAPFLFISILSI